MRYSITISILILIAFSSFGQDVAIATTDKTYKLFQKAHASLDAGNIQQAISIFKQVIAFYEEEGRHKELSENYLGMALAFALNGNYHESIRYHKKALRAHKRYKSGEPADEILINLGLAYHLAGREHKAKRYLN